jgi:flagellar protein FliO/FliZ
MLAKTLSIIASLMTAPVMAAEEKAATFATTPLSTGNMIQTLLGLLLVLACIFIMVWLLKRTQQFHIGAHPDFKVLAALPLGTRERAVLLQVGEEQVLVGVTAQNVSLLHELKTPLAIDSKTAVPSEFAKKLRDVLNKKSEQA